MELISASKKYWTAHVCFSNLSLLRPKLAGRVPCARFQNNNCPTMQRPGVKSTAHPCLKLLGLGFDGSASSVPVQDQQEPLLETPACFSLFEHAQCLEQTSQVLSASDVMVMGGEASNANLLKPAASLSTTYKHLSLDPQVSVVFTTRQGDFSL